MTIAEMASAFTGLQTEINDLVKNYNEAKQTARFADAAELDEKIQKKVKECAGYAKRIAYEECAAEADPMLAAVTRLRYSVPAVKDEDVDGVPVRSVVVREKPIDLFGLHKFIPGGIGVDKGWEDGVKGFNTLMTFERAIDLGIDPTTLNDSQCMMEIKRKYEDGETPASNTKLLATMRLLVAHMIGPDHAANVRSQDVKYLLLVYCKKGRKALTVTCANETKLCETLAEICHRVVTGKGYAIEQKGRKS